MLLAVAPPACAEIDTKYDRFRRLTTVEVRPPERTARGVGSCGRPAVYWHAEVRDPEAGGESIARLVLTATCPEPTYQRCGSIFLLVDDEPVELGPYTADVDILRGGRVFESALVVVSPELLGQLAEASKVEMQLCGTEWQLGSEELATLRAFRSEWQRVEAERLRE